MPTTVSTIRGGGQVDGSNRLRVAFVSFEFTDYCVPIVNALAESADVTFFLPERYADAVRNGLSPAVDHVAFRKPRLRQVVRQLRACRSLVEQIRSARPDVLHLQQGHLWFDLALPLLRDIPLVITVHNVTHHPGDVGGKKTPQFVHDFAFRRASRLIIHGLSLEEGLRARPGVADASIDVVPHVIIGDGDSNPDVRDDGRTVLFFGRIWRYKGLDHLIRAEPLISARVPGVKIVIAGRGEDFGRYRELMTNPDSFVVVNRFVSTAERTSLFARASVVVLPYIEASQSGVVHVAYGLGKPVVATRVGALPDVVDDGRTGLLVPPGDESALADAIVSLLQDPLRRRTFGQAGREKLERDCSPEAVASKTIAVYEKAVAGHRSASAVGTTAGDRAPRSGS
jgi:glycosyltransferase involved in cell wall biosynthesis